MRQILEEIKFRFKCLQSEVLFWAWDISGIIREIKSKLGGSK